MTGEEEYERLRPFSYSKAGVVLICFSVTSPTSFENVKEKWFPEVHRYCPGIPYLIVGTQIELRDDPLVIEKLSQQGMRPITFEQGENLAQELGAIKYVECSVLTPKSVDNVFYEVIVAAFEPSITNHMSTESHPRARNRTLSLDVMLLLNKIKYVFTM
ncbi:Cell division control protein 42 [Gigaspora margarita]|uniref:Cell division control protein 42 n=1 Tax=Gigaspora margarita TaxID=4874 RepID=A0A8H3XFC5_GIGMA|nr:Cell division control protein 42 [Gigaspora margarita]